MLYAHIFHDDKLISRKPFQASPHIGDTLRLRPDIFYEVTEVIWCLDEKPELGAQRINIRTKLLT